MTWADIETNWDAFAPQLQERWGRLTDRDLIGARAGRDELVNCVIKRYRIDAEIAKRHVDDWINSASDPSLSAAFTIHPTQVEASAADGDRPSA